MSINNEEEYLTFYKNVYNIKLSNLDNNSCVNMEYYDSLLREYDEKYHKGRGVWVPLFSGKRFWPEDPRPEDIYLEDIVHSLARINRFNGHTKVPYSVAQHCVMVADILPQRLKMRGLFHESGEAVLGDIVTPIKRYIREFIDPFENKIMLASSKKFGFEMNQDDDIEVKRADLIALYTETRDLTTSGFLNKVPLYQPLEEKITICLSPEDAEKAFLNKYEEIKNAT